jgi:hypothetical protein
VADVDQIDMDKLRALSAGHRREAD